MRIVGLINERAVIERILRHLGRWAADRIGTYPVRPVVAGFSPDPPSCPVEMRTTSPSGLSLWSFACLPGGFQ